MAAARAAAHLQLGRHRAHAREPRARLLELVLQLLFGRLRRASRAGPSLWASAHRPWCSSRRPADGVVGFARGGARRRSVAIRDTRVMISRWLLRVAADARAHRNLRQVLL